MLRSRPGFSISRLAIVAASVSLLLGAGATTADSEVLRVGGTGAASAMLQRIGTAFAAQDQDTRLEVIPGLGSSGAIAAVADGALDFAVAGRALKTEELARSLIDVVLARTPFGLASSHPNPGNIASRDIAAFYLDQASAWPDGAPVRIVLRPRSEADTAKLGASFPGMVAAIEQLRLRAEIPIAVTDQDNVRVAENTEGSLIAVTLTQVVTEKPNLHFLTIDGVEPTLENFERGTYPFGKNFHFIFSTRKTPATVRFIDFLGSAEGTKLLREIGNLAVSP
jgi:phosphate transport system substrate-binding protein